MTRKTPKVTILQGISGSGKTTYARRNFSEKSIISMDNFRVIDGVYKYDSKDNGKIRNLCRHKFLECLSKNHDTVVDNTNLFKDALLWYVNTSLQHGADVEVITLLVKPEVAASRSQTGTPKKVIEQSHKLLKELLRNLTLPKQVKHTVIRENAGVAQLVER